MQRRIPQRAQTMMRPMIARLVVRPVRVLQPRMRHRAQRRLGTGMSGRTALPKAVSVRTVTVWRIIQSVVRRRPITMRPTIARFHVLVVHILPRQIIRRARMLGPDIGRRRPPYHRAARVYAMRVTMV